MSIKIAIVEDDESSAKMLESYIKRYSEETNCSFSIDWFKDGISIASDYKPIYDIIFLDVEMKLLNGIATAEKIREMDKEVILIFVTNMAQYALKGYAVDALDYLLKPVPYFAFSEQLKKSIEKIKRRTESYILVPVENGIIKLDTFSIIYIESIKHKLYLHTANEEYWMYGTMKSLEEKLFCKGFFRCNSCYLVNLRHVNSVQGNFVVVDKHKLAISRPRKKMFMEALSEYII